jgi:serine/threonine protein phosphatase PrpC
MLLIPGNAQHIGQRQQQQDSFGFSNLGDAEFRKHGGILAVVADGMGGMAHGDAASRVALKAFLQAYEAKTETEPIADALLRSIQAANAGVYQLALEMDAAEEMGTTLVATVLKNDQLHWVSAGDSAIFLFRDREYTQLNQPHIFAVELDEQAHMGTIRKEDAMAHPEREALTSFLGMERLSLIDRSLRPIQLREKDVVLLASDGLFKTLTFEQMAAAMDGDAQTIAETLVNRTMAVEKQYQDNVTVLAITVENERPSVASLPPVAPTKYLPVTAKQQRSWLAMSLLLAAVAVVGGYFYFMFSYDPSGKTKGTTSIDQPPAQPVREGEAMDPPSTPPPQRQPGQNPAPPAQEPRQESEPPQSPMKDQQQKPESPEGRK